MRPARNGSAPGPTCRFLGPALLVGLLGWGTATARAQSPTPPVAPPRLLPSPADRIARLAQPAPGGQTPSPPTSPENQPVPPDQPAGTPTAQPAEPVSAQAGPPDVTTEGTPSYGNFPTGTGKGHIPPVGVRMLAPTPPPLPGFPGGFGMGRFAEAPQPPDKDKETEIQRAIRESMTVSLRGAGLLRIYGSFRGDADVSTARFNDLINKFYVLPNDPKFLTGSANLPVTPNQENYAMYARNSRLGFEYYSEPIESFFGIRPGGRMTFDFLNIEQPGGTEAESRPLPRLRVGYVTLQKNDFTLLLGQDWDVISPMVPTINDVTAQWFAGNTGDRRAQAKLLWDHKFENDVRIQVQQALVLLNAVSNDIDGDGILDNQAWGIPGYEGRVGVVVPTEVPSQPLIAGVWGATGVDRTTKFFNGRNNFRTWIAGVDSRVPLSEMFAIQTEAWTGSNLADFRGGIGQGINTATGQTIRASGGFSELVFRPISWYMGSAGFTGDFVARSDIPTGGRARNYAWYIGARFPVGGGLMFGMDYENWYTEYKGYNMGHANLFKVFTQLNF